MQYYKFKFKALYKDITNFLIYPLWLFKRDKGNIPDNHFYKLKRIKNLKIKYDIENLIETGTYIGQTTKFASKIFTKVVSIEIFEPLFKFNKKLFNKSKNVDILFGDSKDLLSKAIKMLDGSILFWLDGHYSGSGTGLGNKICPINEEILNIKENINFNKNSMIIIDDRRLFNGTDDYPLIDEFKSFVDEHLPGSEINYDYDGIIIKLNS